MQRMTCWVLWWLLLCFVFTRCKLSAAHARPTSSDISPSCNHKCADKNHSGEYARPLPKDSSVAKPGFNSRTEQKCFPVACSTNSQSAGPYSRTARCRNSDNNGISDVKNCMEIYNQNIWNGSKDDILQSAKDLEELLEETDIDETMSISVKNIVAAIYKPTHAFSGLEFNANDHEVKSDVAVSDRKLNIRLPKELDVGQNTTVVFCMINLPNTTALNGSIELYEGRLFGVSVSGRNVSGLQERVNITINVTTNINKTQEPLCVFLHMSTSIFLRDGCLTQWNHDQNEVVCSCDHLTYFGVLLVSVSEGTLSPIDQEILSYITIIGCSISLFALVITVLIFITNRKLREDDSKKIHISLSVALILLNLHFLPSEAVAAMSSYGFCLYMALGLHYSLLATFSWMALEGLHLYLLLVKVFNIYVRRYLLKLSLVGWGVPAVIVSVVVIIDKDYYGHAPVDVSNPNGSAICYLTNNIVKMEITGGVFALVFLFNLIMFGVTIKWFVDARSSKEVGRSARNSARKEICSVLSVMSLLGITWGLIFISVGPLTTLGLYAFCILNSLQGFSIFIYFVLSLKRTKVSVEQSTETHTTNSKT